LQRPFYSGWLKFGGLGTAGSGNLTLASPIDEQHYKAREESFGFNVSIPIPGLGVGGSFSVNASKLELLGEFESVRQQSALVAGTGGFDIQVNGHTHLKGGAMTSEAAAGLNRFATQTLTHEDIVNRDRVSGRSTSIGVSTTGTDVKGSSVGHARIDTNRTSDTLSTIAPGTLTITRADLQANAVTQIKAGLREPLVTQRDSLQAHLNQLRLNEPPRCIGCNPYSAPQDPLTVPPATTNNIGLAELPDLGSPDVSSMAGGTNPAWTVWNASVQALQTQINGLQTRINAIDAQVLKGAETVNRSPSPLHQPLLHTFEAAKATRELKDGVAVTAAFGKAAYKTAGDEAGKRHGAAQKLCDGGGNPAACDDAKAWGEGGRYRVALHGLIGALGHGQAGAIANVTVSTATPELVRLAIAAGFPAGTLAHQMLVAAAATAVGAGVGGMPGAAAAFNADTNNRQLHLQETRWIKANGRLLAQHLSAVVGRTVSESEAVYWAGLAGGALVDQAAYNAAVSQLPGLSTAQETQLYLEAKRYITAHATAGFVDQFGVSQRLFVAAPGDRFNTFMYSDLRNSAEYREHMWELAGQNLKSDAPTAAEVAIYNERKALLLKQTGTELALFALTGGTSYGAVRLLNRLSPVRSASAPVSQTIKIDDLDVLVVEHSRGRPGGGGHTGPELTQPAALRAIADTQPQGTRAVVGGHGAEGPDIKFVSLADGSVVETVQVKTASNPAKFEQRVRDDINKSLDEGGSRVIVVMYPNEADAARLIGKLRNNFASAAVAGRSILVISPTGKTIIPLQPFPAGPN
jgi:hypothetical protein